jgi:hypothetical protein
MSENQPVKTHVQKVTHNYAVRFPDHQAREDDPNYVDFNHIKRQWMKDPEKWQCAIGKHRGDFTECSLDKPLELHHAHIEFALMNSVNLEWLERDYPGVSDPAKLGAWVESADNLLVLCEFHHRGHGGVHVASASDYEGLKYIKGFIV